MKRLPRFFCSGGNKIFILCRKFRHIIRVYYTNTESCRLPARLLIGPGPIGLAIVRVSRYNNRRAVIIPRLWPRRYAGAARFRPDGRLYHTASRIWYNNRKAVIIPGSWPRRYAGAARFRPDGRLYHTASRTWYNNRRAVIIPGLCPTARRLRGNRLLMGNYPMPLRGRQA